jgi:hypothetical protein
VAGLVSRRLGLIGAILTFATPFVTLSFLVTTPEAWVPALGDMQHGFPYQSEAGRLVIKDVALLPGASSSTPHARPIAPERVAFKLRPSSYLRASATWTEGDFAGMSFFNVFIAL